MNSQSNTSLQFTFQFYFYVNYLGSCNSVNDSRIYEPEHEVPVPMHHIHLIILEFIALILNGTSLALFIFGEFHTKRGLTTSDSHLPNHNRIGTTSQSRTVSVHTNQSRRQKKPFRRSSFVTGLLMLCICEVIFSLSTLAFTLLLILLPYNISQKPDNPAMHVPPSYILLVMPVIENFLFFVLDVSLICRNWCVCLITCARAEIVMWPLGSKTWQHNLRRPKRFLGLLGIIFCLAILISCLRHSDFIGLMCYDSISQSYALWTEDYLMSNDQLIIYMSSVVLPFQTLIPWILIVICTILIIVKLKPWNKNTGNWHFKHSKSLDDLPSKTGYAQQDAIRKRQEGQTRATLVVLTVALLFGILESMNFFTTICQTVGIITDMKLVRMLETIGNTLIMVDSICNFFIFISMMAYFRDMFVQMCCCRSDQMESSGADTCT